MNDRELLEKAAMAAGIVIVGPVEKFIVQFDERHKGGFIVENAQGGHSAWNPLNDDGDALRLAVSRRFHINVFSATDEEIKTPGFVEIWRESDSDPLHIEYVDAGDYLSATRRAIVRAASELA